MKSEFSLIPLFGLAGTAISADLFPLMTILKRSCTVVITKTLARIAILAGCAVGLAAPVAQAQTDTKIQTTAPRIKFGAQNDRFLDLSEHTKERMRTECGPLANAHLRTGCIDGLAIEEDQRSMRLRDGLTGDSHGRMNSIDRTFQGPEMYDPRLGR